MVPAVSGAALNLAPCSRFFWYKRRDNVGYPVSIRYFR
jgi:hypothetical protein